MHSCIQGHAEVSMSSAGIGVPSNPFANLRMRSRIWDSCCSGNFYLEFNAMQSLIFLSMIDELWGEYADIGVDADIRADWLKSVDWVARSWLAARWHFGKMFAENSNHAWGGTFSLTPRLGSHGSRLTM